MTTKRKRATTGRKPDGTSYMCWYCKRKIPRNNTMRLVWRQTGPGEGYTETACKRCYEKEAT